MSFADLLGQSVTGDVYVAWKDHPCLRFALGGSDPTVNLGQGGPIRVGGVDAVVEDLDAVKCPLELLTSTDPSTNSTLSGRVKTLLAFAGLRTSPRTGLREELSSLTMALPSDPSSLARVAKRERPTA